MNANTSQALIEAPINQGAWVPDENLGNSSQAASWLWFESDIFLERERVVPLKEAAGFQAEQVSGHRASFLSTLEFQMAQHEDAIRREIADLRRLYVISDEADVSKFLQSHRALPGLLLEIKEPLAEAFGEDARIDLSLAVTGEEAPILRLAVSWPGTLDDANTALERFDNSFWLTNYERSSGRILVSFDLV